MSVFWPININIEPSRFDPPELTIKNDQVVVLTWNGIGPVKIAFADPQPSVMPTLARAPFFISQCECNSGERIFAAPGMDFTSVPEGTYTIEADGGGVGRMTGKLTVTKPGQTNT